jgi:hypothetical protein
MQNNYRQHTESLVEIKEKQHLKLKALVGLVFGTRVEKHAQSSSTVDTSSYKESIRCSRRVLKVVNYTYGMELMQLILEPLLDYMKGL